MGHTAKLFMSGRSQAIRLPAACRMAAKEVQIEPLGDGLWIRANPAPDENMGGWLERFYASTDCLPDEFLSDRQDPPPQARDWSLT